MRRTLVTLCLATAMAVATVSSPLVGVLAPLLRDEIPMPPVSVGLLVAIYAGVSALASWPAGYLTDRIGGRLAVTVVFAGSAAYLLGIASATSYAWLAWAMVVAGLANSMVNPATNHVIAETVEPGSRGLVAGVKMAGVQVAVFAVGLAIPLFDAVIGWRVPLAVSTVVFCLGGMSIALTRLERANEGTGSRKLGFAWSADLVALTLYSLLMSAGASASLTYLPLYSVDELDATAGLGGLSVAVAGVCAIGGRLYWGRMTERGQTVTRPLLTISVLSVLSGLLIMAASEMTDLFLWVGSAGLGLFALSFSASTTVALILTAAKGATGKASGVMFAGFMIGFGLGPTGFGLLVESAGYAAAWVGVILAFATATLVSLAAIRLEQQAPGPRPGA